MPTFVYDCIDVVVVPINCNVHQIKTIGNVQLIIICLVPFSLPRRQAGAAESGVGPHPLWVVRRGSSESLRAV